MWFPIFFSLIYSITQQPSTRFVSFSRQLASSEIRLEFRLTPELYKDSGTISLRPANYILYPNPSYEKVKLQNNTLSWSTKADELFYVDFSDIVGPNVPASYLTEPGDAIIINTNAGGLQFNGKGYEKYRLQFELAVLNWSVPKPKNTKDYTTLSVLDYFQWVDYLQKRMDVSLPLINSYRGKISEYAFMEIKDNFIGGIVNKLVSKFYSLKEFMAAAGMPTEDVLPIFDTSFFRVSENWIGHALSKPELRLKTLNERIYRAFAFDKARVPSKGQLQILLCRDALKVLKGQKRESFIVNSFPKLIMKEVGFTPETEKLLDEYYAELTYSEWKIWMKEQEWKIRRRKISSKAPNFLLTDTEGNAFTNEKLRGKFAIIHFWKNGNPENAKMFMTIKRLYERFKQYEKVAFVNVSIDSNKDQWFKTITQQKLPGIHVYTADKGSTHEILRQYAVTNYPTIWLMNPDGYVMNAYPEIDFTKDDGTALSQVLFKHLIGYPNDGPYIWHENKSPVSYRIQDSVVIKKEYSNRSSVFPVQTDLDHRFFVKLKSSLSIEPTEYSRPEKLLALSDIEGNFDALRKLLQGNKVIDGNYNWIFDKGHIVFAGDMFDRGSQVTECLWLLYSLEEKAKAAGGYVHFILGNHEIMNMKGDYRYVAMKYKRNALLMGKTLSQLYNDNSELGRWLRTKNVMEKMGDLLFVHGGISHAVWRMPLTITEMNNLVRPYYDRIIDSTNQNLVILYGSRRVGPEHSYTSPFWFRGYWGDIDNPREIPTTEQLDSTLQKFGVNHIITGHTIIADTISTRYEDKVINTDTQHALGKSEALLIDGISFYRVKADGKKILLFVEDPNKLMFKFVKAEQSQ